MGKMILFAGKEIPAAGAHAGTHHGKEAGLLGKDHESTGDTRLQGEEMQVVREGASLEPSVRTVRKVL